MPGGICRPGSAWAACAPAPGLSWSRVKQATFERVRARACVHVFSGVHVCVCVCMRSMINKASWPGRHAGSGRGCRHWAAGVRTATSTEDSRGGRAGGPRVEARGGGDTWAGPQWSRQKLPRPRSSRSLPARPAVARQQGRWGRSRKKRREWGEGGSAKGRCVVSPARE